MDFGATLFFTDYSMAPGALAQALEQRCFESLWAAEHSHIPLSRRTPFPGGGELPRKYYDAMDPFVVLAAAAAATKTLKVGTAVCLVNQRDPIQTAKQVASLDQVSGGRFLFGIGNGWNQDEMENHGTSFPTRHKLVRERIEAMKAIWTQSPAEYHGEFVNFDPITARPRPVQKPYPPILVGGGFPQGPRRAVRYGDGWFPVSGQPHRYGDLFECVPKFRAMLVEAGRDPATCPVSVIDPTEDLDLLKRYRDLGIARVVVTVPVAEQDEMLPILDRWAKLIASL